MSPPTCPPISGLPMQWLHVRKTRPCMWNKKSGVSFMLLSPLVLGVVVCVGVSGGNGDGDGGWSDGDNSGLVVGVHTL